MTHYNSRVLLPCSYPFHFHLAGDVGNNSYLTDNSVYNSWWRCKCSTGVTDGDV